MLVVRRGRLAGRIRKGEKKMKKKYLAGLAVGVMMLGMVGSANATIIKNDLEWLEFSSTVGLSRDTVEATLLSPGGTFAGYRYASRLETAMLLDSYVTGEIKNVDDGWRKSTSLYAAAFINQFGATATFNYYAPTRFTNTLEGQVEFDSQRQAVFYYGLDTETFSSNTATYYGFVSSLTLETDSQAGYFMNTNGTDPQYLTPSTIGDSTGNWNFASLLAREIPPPTPTPEPATMLLMGTGLAGLIGAHRKKKK